MLQLETAGRQARENLRKKLPFPPSWNTPKELETATDNYIEAFLNERFEVSKTLGPGFFLTELFDRSLRTDERERMDDPEKPASQKLEMIRALDRMNDMLMLYSRYIEIIEPVIERIARKQQRPAKLLELAGGAGGFAFALAEAAVGRGLPVEVTGSDVVPEYVEACTFEANARDLPVTFQVIDAFSTNGMENTSWDIVLISQSMHHFTPGRLARIIAESTGLGASVFLGLDGHRGLDLLAGVPLFAMLQGMKDLLLDGYTSARKFYSETELDLIAEIATGSNRHEVRFSWPLSVLEIPFEP